MGAWSTAWSGRPRGLGAAVGAGIDRRACDIGGRGGRATVTSHHGLQRRGARRRSAAALSKGECADDRRGGGAPVPLVGAVDGRGRRVLLLLVEADVDARQDRAVVLLHVERVAPERDLAFVVGRVLGQWGRGGRRSVGGGRVGAQVKRQRWSTGDASRARQADTTHPGLTPSGARRGATSPPASSLLVRTGRAARKKGSESQPIAAAGHDAVPPRKRAGQQGSARTEELAGEGVRLAGRLDDGRPGAADAAVAGVGER